MKALARVRMAVRIFERYADPVSFRTMAQKTKADPRHRSREVTEGPSRAPARAMLRAVGFSEEDFNKPQIGVASSWNEVTPCNYLLNRVAQAAKQGARAAGGVPVEFTTIAVSDGIAMGHEGMRASLVSREIIADSVELVAHAERFDGLVTIAGCGKAVLNLLEQGITPRDIITKAALENAIAVVVACGGSTNAVLHLLAIANEVGAELEIDDFDRIARRTPIVADMKPWGRFVMLDIDRAGGIPTIMRELLDAGLLNGDALTVTGKTVAENLDGVGVPTNRDVVHPLDGPIRAMGGFAGRRGSP